MTANDRQALELELEGTGAPDRPSRLTVAVLALLGAASLAGLMLAPHHHPRPAPTITEDDPRWDCRTMGNHVCGPTP